MTKATDTFLFANHAEIIHVGLRLLSLATRNRNDLALEHV